MEKLIAQFLRLYLMPGMAPPDDRVRPVTLVSGDDLTRAIVIDFARGRHGAPDQHWTELCAVANRLQEAYGFPAPAVSITGASSFRLWLSLEEPVPLGDARRFLSMLRDEHFPELDLQATTEVELPPCLNAQTGKWAAFIHPGMGASFAEEAGLEMAPPLTAQLAFLEGLESIGKAQFFDALVSMKQGEAPQATAPAAIEPPPKEGLLLKDATLEDIVRHLHAMNIEPTFRHLLRPD
ncbi:hypothetical protein [Massilia sp. IC2-476]|uniref:hypothetical protein n=1 Tax=Massilia sp. IC2-476 TaxID=2887199 RepID=UPI001D12EA68|nr:hypothetical protein [Massilia sp. IC2-476]MCC2974413.1 hypothetical protein [Massilia sp. IC2-476]